MDPIIENPMSAISPSPKKFPFWAKLSFTIFTGFALLAALVFYGSKAYAKYHENKVYPGIKIGQLEIGGMTRNEIVNLMENLNNRYTKEGVEIVVENTPKKVKIAKLNPVVGSENVVEAIKLDSEALSSIALKIGKDGAWYQKLLDPIFIRYQKISITAPVRINSVVYKEALKDALSGFEEPYQNAGVKNVNEYSGSAQIVPEKSGLSFDYDKIAEDIKKSFSVLSFEPVKVNLVRFSPTISENDVEKILPRIRNILQHGPITLIADKTASSTRPTTTEWVLSTRDLVSMLEVRESQNSGLVFSLNEEKITKFLISILPAVEIPSEDAKFTIENNKVKEFKPSREGSTIDFVSTVSLLKNTFEERNFTAPSSSVVSIVMEKKIPIVQTADMDFFGIVELVGSGSSTFKDSHSRRIKNIAHAVEKLNGVLIKPGEEFSAIKYAGPFTAENGYLPEAVIVGRTIKDEIGGGMCQIGTTLFRMAMNTGLPITERRNHSLVVSYYADPVNGNPGTDATLYEPYLDLKFLNDTNNYLLLRTEIDYKKQLLLFNLYGTKDGRSGGFTRPKVSKWINPPAETEYIVSNKLKPGEEKCQPAYRGAVASFTYTRVTPEGEKIDQVFDSYYRPLPKICTTGPSSTPANTPTQ